MYSIGEFSRLTQVSVKTLRYYDAIGLLRPRRRAGGYRAYGADDVERLNRILVLKDLGLALREIRELLLEPLSPAQLHAIVRRELHAMERRVDRERARLARAQARFKLLEGSAQTAAHDVAERVSGPWIVASIRDALATHTEAERLFEELARQTSRGETRRTRGVIWHACQDGAVDCEVFEILASPVQVRGRAQVRVLPAERVASLVYRGEHGYLPAYQAVRAWIAASGVRINGPKRELFLDEAAGPDALTEVQFPLDPDVAGGTQPETTTMAPRTPDESS